MDAQKQITRLELSEPFLGAEENLPFLAKVACHSSGQATHLLEFHPGLRY